MAGDALASREFASITGPAGEGVLFTFPPDPRKRPTAAAIVKEFKDKGVDPEGYTLYTYAAFQVWAQAAAKAGTIDPQKVAAAMRTGTWDTVLGPMSFDKKGDITGGGWAVYRWDKDGNYDEITEASGADGWIVSRSSPASGNVSSSQKLACVTAPVRKAMPVRTSKPAHRLLDQTEMGAEAGEEGGERLDRQRRRDERNAKAERIDRQHAGALGDRFFRRRNRQNRSEDRPDAWRPAKREGQPHQIGAPQADRLGDFETLLAHQQRDRRQAKEVQAHNDDDNRRRRWRARQNRRAIPRRWRWRWRRARRIRWRSRARTAAPRQCVSRRDARLRLPRRQSAPAKCR